MDQLVTRRLTLSLFLLVPLLWLFRRVLFLGEIFAFRDSSYYYFPFYQYVQKRWSGGVPLWNPLDGIGQPLLGDPTAAVFYPGKLIFLVPLPSAYGFAFYVVGHLLLAGFGAYLLARTLQASHHGATLAGVAYELSGHIVFQYCNPIYLVAAAWLPFGWLYFYRVVRHDEQRTWNVICLGMSLGLMILGGAAQMAMHCVLCAMVWCCLSVVDRASNWRLTWRDLPCRTCGHSFLLLGGACCIAVGLAAVQILPSKEWSARSERAVYEVPRSVLEVGQQYAATGSATLDGLWKRDVAQTSHDRKIYNFSVGPWRWNELFWPNISGRFGPVATRWIQGLPAEGRMWSASLYLGLLPVCLALVCSRLRRGSLSIRWLSWLVVLSMLAAVGEYGVGWLLDELRFQSNPDFQPSSVTRGFGGLYWFLTVSVPNYVEFRYPAKWWTVTSLGISLLAARGWPLLWSKSRRQTCMRLVVLSLAVLAATAIVRLLLVNEVPATAAFGPFDGQLSLWHLGWSVLHVGVVSSGLIWLATRPRCKATNIGLLAVCALELTIAQGWMIQTVANKTRPKPAGAETVWRKSGHDYPSEFRTVSSLRRFHEARDHDVRTLMPKYHLLTGQRQLNSISAMQCADYAAVWDSLADTSNRQMPAPELLNMFCVTPRKVNKAWLVSRWQKIPTTEQPLGALTRQVLLDDDGQIRDFREVAIVETDDAIPVPQEVTNQRLRCQVISERAERIEVGVTTDGPALLVMCDQFYPDWLASITTAGRPATAARVYRVNRVMRGVFVPGGDCRVVLRYLPRSFYIGAALSLTSWIVCLVLLAKRVPRIGREQSLV